LKSSWYIFGKEQLFVVRPQNIPPPCTASEKENKNFIAQQLASAQTKYFHHYIKNWKGRYER
jgi:hypothetical protein